VVDAFFKNEQALRDAIVKAAGSLQNALKFDVAELEMN
jgi:hypothetical protein